MWMSQTVLASLEEDLSLVAQEIERVLTRVEGNLMREVSGYVGEKKGKMLRPQVACLAARAQGCDLADVARIRIGASVELIHTATLLHDDVIDKAPLRRGRATVNARWGDDVAILMADYLYASSFDLALSVLSPEVLRVLSQSTQDMTMGEMFQIERRGHWLTADEYLRIIRSKTARLFSASAALGAMVGGASGTVVKKFADFGHDYGVAFQLTDDALDYSAQAENWGKRVGSDLAEGKQTLPLLHTLDHASPADREQLLAILADGRDFKAVHEIVDRYDGIRATRERAREYCQSALQHLKTMPDNESMDRLRALAQALYAREY